MNNIHHTALIGPNVEIGDNNYIGPFCIIGFPAEHKEHWPKCNACHEGGFDKAEIGKVIIGNNNKFTGHVTVDAGTEGDAKVTIIQDGCWFLKHSHIGHDAVICDNVTVSCGAKVGGHTVIGEGCNLGLNAVIHQRQMIQPGCMIGMGSVVTKKLITNPFKKYAGNPAKLIGENDSHPNYNIYLKDSI